jgi:hypothetical protein
MSDDHFWVDPHGLAKSGNGFADQREQVASLHRHIQDLLTRARVVISGDSNGNKFLKDHLDAGVRIRDGVKKWGETSGATGAGVVGAANLFSAAEDGATATAHDLGSKMKGSGSANGLEQPATSPPASDGSGDEVDRLPRTLLSRPERSSSPRPAGGGDATDDSVQLHPLKPAMVLPMGEMTHEGPLVPARELPLPPTGGGDAISGTRGHQWHPVLPVDPVHAPLRAAAVEPAAVTGAPAPGPPAEAS